MSGLRLLVWISLLVWLFTPITSLVAQTNRTRKTTKRDAANSQNAELKSLYEAHQWFKLRDAVQAKRASAFYRGVIASAFNDVEQAEKNLKFFIKSAPESEQVSEARALLIYIYQRAGHYRQAFSEIERALAVKPDNAGLKNARALFSTLSQYPEQSVVEHRFSRIRYRMKGGNMFIPVEVNLKSANYVVDTGANFSLISEAEAKRLGLTIHESGGSRMGDSAGARVDVRIAVADQLTVGNIRLRHVSFFVVRDDQQPFIDLPSGERGVLGLPVLLAFQTLRWKQEGTFEIGFAPGSRKGTKPNLCFEGSNLIFEGEFRQSHINMFLDTGATRTRVLPLFAKEFATFINEFGRKGSDRVTGVSGSLEVDVITLPELALRISGFAAVLAPAQVLLKDTTSDSRWWHIWGGLDLLNQARVVTVDLKSMRLDLE
jgi:predicted aspartyl protease